MPSSGNSSKLRAADVDFDGDIDLFGVFHGHQLKWFPNTDGQGTFGPAQLIADLDGTCALRELADMDGDGDLDLLVVGDDSDEIMIFRNMGDGSFIEEDAIDLGGRPAALAVADINGDGHPDLLVTLDLDEGAGVGILFGSAEGFGPLIPHAGLHRGAPSSSLLVGDMDLIGGLDLVLNAANDTLVVARNVAGNASEWVVEALDIPGGELGYPYRRPQLMDIDNDGDLDIGETRGSAIHWLRNRLDEGGVLSFEENVIEPWTSNGDGAFGRSICSDGACLVYVPNNPSLPVRWSSYLPLLGDLAFSNDLPALPRGRRPLLADFDGDGRDDLLMEVDQQLTWFKATMTRDDAALELPLIDTLCLAGAPVALPEATPAGGRWYGQQIANGLLFRSNLPGTMDLSAVHAAYPEGGCPLAGAASIRVIQGPQITTTVPSVVCSADAPIVMESVPSNVAWYGMDGGNVMDPAVWNGGYVVCEYTDATGQMCSDLKGPVLRWNSLPAQLAEVPTLCATDAITEIHVIAAPPSNVVWEGPVLNATASGAQF
ncbi:MAG: VCBS repeat-containing protein, partial [Flavobacteriales bacterium]|nr:VCBS repeat-containing protein [Flavobacteriales bacterium]